MYPFQSFRASADLEPQGHEEAQTLVNVYRGVPSQNIPGQSEPNATLASSDETSKNDADLQRAKDLVELHYRVKVKYQEEGLDAELRKARDAVARVHKNMDSKNLAC